MGQSDAVSGCSAAPEMDTGRAVGRRGELREVKRPYHVHEALEVCHSWGRRAGILQAR